MSWTPNRFEWVSKRFPHSDLTSLLALKCSIANQEWIFGSLGTPVKVEALAVGSVSSESVDHLRTFPWSFLN